MPGIFVTGTDTGSGKTWCSCQILHNLNRAGFKTTAMKPVASGAVRGKNGLQNEDALQLQRAASVAVAYNEINPYVFEPAIAPHIAAQQAGVEIQLDVVSACYEKLLNQSDWVVVEGVGGWRVPLSSQLSMVDLVQELQLPVVMVVAMRLGCLNHALLTAESIRAAGVPLVGWIANHIDTDFEMADENINFLNNALAVPCLADVARYETDKTDEFLQEISLEFVNK